MRLMLTGRNVEISPALREMVERRLAKLERLLADSAVSAQVVLTRERHRHVTDVTLHARGDHVLSGLGAATSCRCPRRKRSRRSPCRRSG